MRTLLVVGCALAALAACAPKAQKTVAAIDPRTSSQLDDPAPRAPDQGLAGGRARFAGADLNRDGKVTLAEAETQTKDRFARLDADHDGVVTAEEIHGGLRPPD